MNLTAKLLFLLIVPVNQTQANGWFPEPNQPSAEAVSFYGRLLFVSASYGPPRALLCEPKNPVPSDYSTCINLLGADLTGLETTQACLVANGGYASGSDSLYLGGVGKEFGALTVSSLNVDSNCRHE